MDALLGVIFCVWHTKCQKGGNMKKNTFDKIRSWFGEVDYEEDFSNEVQAKDPREGENTEETRERMSNYSSSLQFMKDIEEAVQLNVFSGRLLEFLEFLFVENDKVFENLVEKISTTSCQLVIRNGFRVSGPDGDKFFVAASKATEYLEGHLDYQMSSVPVAAAVRNGKIVSVREATKEEIEKKKKEHDEKAPVKAT